MQAMGLTSRCTTTLKCGKIVPTGADQMTNQSVTGASGFALIEPVAKGVALFTAVCLGVAFLHDTVFFFVLDRRLSGLLVISDHIETAISAIP